MIRICGYLGLDKRVRKLEAIEKKRTCLHYHKILLERGFGGWTGICQDCDGFVPVDGIVRRITPVKL